MSLSRWEGVWRLLAGSDVGLWLLAGVLVGAALAALLDRRRIKALVIIGIVFLVPAPLAIPVADLRIEPFDMAGFVVGLLYFGFGFVGFPLGWLIGVAATRWLEVVRQ